MTKPMDDSSGRYLSHNPTGQGSTSIQSRDHSLQQAQDTQSFSRVRRWFRSVFEETLWGIRKDTERVRAQKEYYQVTAEAVEQMHHLEMTPKRVVDAYNRAKQQTNLDHELATQQKQLEIERLKKAKERLAEEDALERARIHAAIAEFKKKSEPSPSTGTGDEQSDPDTRKAREVMNRLYRKARMEDEFEAFRKEQFAAIDAEVASGALSAEEAEERKKRLQEQIDFELQEL